jgi:hypothetical protein
MALTLASFGQALKKQKNTAAKVYRARLISGARSV